MALRVRRATYLTAINGADVGVRVPLTPTYGKNTATAKYSG